jgi:effector-binding domain-containing protein
MGVTIKEVPAGLYLLSEHKGIRIPDIGGIAARVVPEMYAAAMQAGLSVTGPSVFFYEMGAAPDDPLDLEIGLPTPATDHREAGVFPIGESAAGKFATLEHPGPMSTIQESYAVLYAGIAALGLTPTGHGREVYARWFSPDSPDNVTELQVEIG